MPKILWVEDDYYHVAGLIRGLEREGYTVDYATSANEAYHKVQGWRDYEIMVVDIILPLRDQRGNQLLPEVERWRGEEYAGIGLLKYLFSELKVEIPVIVLSVVADELAGGLAALGVEEVLLKRGILPRQVQEAVHEVLERRRHGIKRD